MQPSTHGDPSRDQSTTAIPTLQTPFATPPNSPLPSTSPSETAERLKLDLGKFFYRWPGMQDDDLLRASAYQMVVMLSGHDPTRALATFSHLIQRQYNADTLTDLADVARLLPCWKAPNTCYLQGCLALAQRLNQFLETPPLLKPLLLFIKESAVATDNAPIAMSASAALISAGLADTPSPNPLPTIKSSSTWVGSFLRFREDTIEWVFDTIERGCRWILDKHWGSLLRSIPEKENNPEAARYYLEKSRSANLLTDSFAKVECLNAARELLPDTRIMLCNRENLLLRGIILRNLGETYASRCDWESAFFTFVDARSLFTALSSLDEAFASEHETYKTIDELSKEILTCREFIDRAAQG